MTDSVNDPNPENKEDDHQTVLLDESGAPKAEPSTKVEVAEVKADAAQDPVVYEPTGDVGLDMALEFIGKQGLAFDHPAVKAAAEGDFSILKATLAQKGVPGWEQMVALGEAAFTRTKEAEAKKSQDLTSLVHKEAGGKGEWEAVQKWAAANATPEEKTQINALLNQGGLAAKGAVKYLMDAYGRANNVVKEPREGAPNAGVTPGGAGNGPLTAREYSAEVQKLSAKLGGRMEESREYKALQQRRQASRD